MACLFLRCSGRDEAAPLLARLSGRDNPEDAATSGDTEAAVRDILETVRTGGVEALTAYTRRFDAPEFTDGQFRVAPAAIAAAADSIDQGDAAIIAAAARNIRTFHEAQKERSWFVTAPDGTVLGQMVVPVDRAGLYVPAGRAGATPLISSLLMGAIPALVAGVQEIVVVSPPRPDGTVNPYILAAAHLLGITEVYAAGSAWGVAALAYGAGPLRPVDVIAGPGNIFVATAKRLLLGKVGIDMIAGPSEVAIIADATADPAWVAADMLSQAEHDALASAVCLTDDPALAAAVQAELDRQCALLPRADIAAASLRDFGAVVLTPDLAAAADIANALAPEHLELLVADPWSLVPLIRHAGAVFMGPYSPEPMGDYFAGPNHVLPTMGTARFSSALGVTTFCKKTSLVAASKSFTETSAAAVARLARLEGLEGHARSALCRRPAAEKD